MDELIRPKAAAKILGCSTKHIAKMSERGFITTFRLPSGHRRYLAEEIKRIREGVSIAPESRKTPD